MRKPDWSDPWVKLIGALAAAIVTVATALAALGVIGIHTGERGTDTVTVPEPIAAVPQAVAVDTTGDADPDKIVELDQEAREVAADLVESDDHDLAIEDGADLRGDDESGPVAVPRPPLAADSIDGCRTRFLTTNWSYRTVSQSEVKWFPLHYTAGRDIPGSRSDVDGLTSYGNNPSARVSWHFNMDKDGNCDYNVPLRYKAWTFGDANSRSINVEVAGSGEAPYLRPAGYRKLRSIIRQVRKAYPQIRVRVGSVSGCTSGRSGIVTHWQGGACSGGHTDIRPHDLGEVVSKLRVSGEVRKQRKIVRARKAKHRKVHERYERRGCRYAKRMHKSKLRNLRREECRNPKVRGKRQHKGIRRAERRLRELRQAS